jgi:nitrite reductase/ring-hydroxylating ferredoxin subunit
LCAVGDVADGAGIVVPVSRGFPIMEVIVIRNGASFIGYWNRCMHMPVPLNMLDRVEMSPDGSALVCDHHYATFRIADGYCTAGPCKGESLQAVALAVRDGAVFVA